MKRNCSSDSEASVITQLEAAEVLFDDDATALLIKNVSDFTLLPHNWSRLYADFVYLDFTVPLLDVHVVSTGFLVSSYYLPHRSSK